MPIYEYRCKKHGLFEDVHTYKKNSRRNCPECGKSCKSLEIPTSFSFKVLGYSPDNKRKSERRFKEDMKIANEPMRVPPDELKDMAKDEEKEKGKPAGSILGKSPKKDGQVDKTGCQQNCKLKNGTEYNRLTKKGLQEIEKVADYRHQKGKSSFKESNFA